MNQFCGSCGKQNTLSDSFCTECGKRLPEKRIKREKSAAKSIGIGAILLVLMAIVIGLNHGESAEEKTIRVGMETGTRYLEEMEYSSAVLEFQKVIDVDPMNKDAYLGLAEAYLSMGEPDKAMAVLEEGYERTGAESLMAMRDEIAGEMMISERDDDDFILEEPEIQEEQVVIELREPELLWRVKTEGKRTSAPSSNNDLLYVTKYRTIYCEHGPPYNDSYLYVLDRESGEETMRMKTTNTMRPPTIAEGMIYTGGHALDSTNLEAKWELVLPYYSEYGVIIQDKTVYVANYEMHAGDYLYAIDSLTGEEKWRHKIWDDYLFGSYEKTLYLNSFGFGSEIKAIDTENSVEKWSVNQADRYYSTGVLAGSVIFVPGGHYSSSTLSLYALDATTGNEIWRLETDGEWSSSVHVIGENVFWANQYYDSDKMSLYATDALTGNKNWVSTIEGFFPYAIAAGENMVFVGCREGKIYGIESDGGEVLWTYQIESGVESLTFDEGVLYATDQRGSLYAIGFKE